MFVTDVNAGKDVSVLLNIELQVWNWCVAVWINGEDANERLEEHGAHDYIAALRLVWVKILSVDLAVLGTWIIDVVEGESWEWNIDVVSIVATIEINLEGIFPDVSEWSTSSIRNTESVFDTILHVSAAIKLAFSNNFHQIGKSTPGIVGQTKSSEGGVEEHMGLSLDEKILHVLAHWRQKSSNGRVVNETEAKVLHWEGSYA